ncbi:immunoglobulin-like domain-containing protein [Clostridium sp.]|uniref:immunoglobulin-like domain-containing protein n=1 Tax=Clostridium sp. TaxID=1506 RepID=UPI002636374F|nr:immunoglobulin-like domain-containing protein [Clostridium sp.]
MKKIIFKKYAIHRIESSSLYLYGVNIEGIVDGKNVKDQSVVDIVGLSMINKINNIKKLGVYAEAELNIKEDLEEVRELYAEGEIKIKNGAKINVEHLYGTFAFDVEVADNETLIEGNYIKSKIFVGDIYLSDKLIREGYRLNTICGAESIVVDLFNPQSTNISTNYAPVIKNLREIIIREGNTIDLTEGVEAWDFEDGDITEKIVFPNIDLESLPVGKHEVSYEVTDSDGNKTIMNRTIYVIKNASPIIKGAKDITIKIGDVDNFDLLNGIIVTDDKDNDLKPEVIGKIEKPSPGTNKDSTITYTVTDSDGNSTTVTRVITVTNQLPVIKGLDEIVIKQGEELDLLSGVTASDEEDGDITKDLVITGAIDINEEGSHILLYKVTDSDGNTTEMQRIVVVEKDNEVIPPTEELESLLPPVIAEAITNNLVSLISGTGIIDDPVEIEFNNISNDNVDSLLSDIKNLNIKVNSLENKNGYTFVKISILKESNSNTFKVSEFSNLKEEIHIVLKVKDEYVNIADKLREFAENNIEDSNDDNTNSDVDNNTDNNTNNNVDNNTDNNISNNVNKDDIINDNITNNNVNNDSINFDNHKPIKELPKTGDNSSIVMLASVALLSLLFMILNIFGIKKKINLYKVGMSDNMREIK